jgi:hypothetical protein
MGGHNRHVKVRGRAERIEKTDRFALQVGKGSNVLMREQLEAAGVHTRQHRDRVAGIKLTNGPWREPKTKSISRFSNACAYGGPPFTRT